MNVTAERAAGSCAVHRALGAGDWLDAAALLHDHVEWMRGWTDFDPIAEQPALAQELTDPAGAYTDPGAGLFLARWDGIAVGSVAVRCHPDGSSELKRMYLRPVARGRGFADLLVAAAITFASDLECRTLWLETVAGAMDAAIAVYRRNGFVASTERVATLSMHGLVVMERSL